MKRDMFPMNRYHFCELLIALVLFVGVGSSIYYAGLDAPFQYDSSAKLYARAHYFVDGAVSATRMFPQRPLPVLTFYADYLLWGMIPGYFRVTNLAILCLASLLVTVTVYLVINIPGSDIEMSPTGKKALSLIVGAIFLVHPAQVYVTLYVWQRMALMACLFYFGAIATYMALRSGIITNKILGYLICVCAFVCATLSKENSFTLPIALLLFDRVLFRENWGRLAQRAAAYAAISIMVAGLLSWLEHPHGDVTAQAGAWGAIAQYCQESGLTLTEVFLTQIRMMFNYLRIILIPLPSGIQLVSPQIVSHSLWEPVSTFWAAAGAMGLVGTAILLIRVRPLSATGILFFLITLAPEGLLAPQYSFASYRAALPMMGVLFVLTDVVVALLGFLRENARPRSTLVALSVLGISVVSVLALSSHEKAVVWRDSVELWSRTVNRFSSRITEVEPRPATQALTNLGLALSDQSRREEAVESLKKALDITPDYAPALALLGVANMRMNRLAEAESLLRRAVALDSDSGYNQKQLGLLLLELNQTDQAVERLNKAYAMLPFDPELRDLAKRFGSKDKYMPAKQ